MVCHLKIFNAPYAIFRAALLGIVSVGFAFSRAGRLFVGFGSSQK